MAENAFLQISFHAIGLRYTVIFFETEICYLSAARL